MRKSRLLVVSAAILFAVGCSQPELPNAIDGMDPLQLTDTNFQAEVVQSEIPVLVDMWAPWCQPCLAMKPIIRGVAKDLHGVAKVGELNVEENPFIKQKYGVDEYPTLLIFVNGKESQRLVGPMTRTELVSLLLRYAAASGKGTR